MKLSLPKDFPVKKLFCIALALLLFLSGAAFAEEDGEVFFEYPQFGFTLRLPREFLNTRGMLYFYDPMEAQEGSGVCIFSAVYLCMTEEEFEAIRDDAGLGGEIRGLDAVMPFITLLIVKGETTLADAVELTGGDLEHDVIEVQAKTDGSTFYACTKYDQTEVPDQAYAEEYAYLISKREEILDGIDYYVPYVPYTQNTGTADGDGDALTGKALFGSHEYTVPSAWSAEAKKDAFKENKSTYTVRVVDQNGDPVPEAAVGFCLDTGCVPVETDENGVAVYFGAPDRYHVRVVDAPDEYDYPDDTDTYLGPESGKITLVITKE